MTSRRPSLRLVNVFNATLPVSREWLIASAAAPQTAAAAAYGALVTVFAIVTEKCIAAWPVLLAAAVPTRLMS